MGRLKLDNSCLTEQNETLNVVNADLKQVRTDLEKQIQDKNEEVVRLTSSLSDKENLLGTLTSSELLYSIHLHYYSLHFFIIISWLNAKASRADVSIWK